MGITCGVGCPGCIILYCGSCQCVVNYVYSLQYSVLVATVLYYGYL